MIKALLAVGAVVTVTAGIPVAEAMTTFVVGGTNGVGGPPSQNEINGYIAQGYIAAPGPDDHVIGIDYPAQLWPLAGSITLDDSVAQGVETLDEQVRATDGPITMVGTSQGAVVLNYEKRRLLADPPPPGQSITFVTVADPTNTDGGALAKLPRVHIPILNFTVTGPTPETPYNTTEYVREYDGVADFPDHPLNLLADANAIAGGFSLHPHYTGLDFDDAIVTVSPPNSLGGVTTHYLFPTQNLPLTQPLRDAGVNPAFVDAIDKPLRTMIDAGYDGPRPAAPETSTSLRADTKASNKPTSQHISHSADHHPVRKAIKAAHHAKLS